MKNSIISMFALITILLPHSSNCYDHLRYKESISKGTRGLKEKLLARNSSVKEISRGVQRKMSAGIAGVARMIERLELASERTVPLSNCEAIEMSSSKGKDVQEEIAVQAHLEASVETASNMSSHAQPLLFKNYSRLSGSMQACHV